VQVPLGQAHAPDVDRAGGLDHRDAVDDVAHDHLGRPAAEVDHAVRPRHDARELPGRPEERQLGLLAPATTSGSTPSRSRIPVTKSAAFSASRLALVATNRTVPAPRSATVRA
jgi:hypothetical protein